MANVSPGVYSKIIDLSTYVAEVPSTIGMIVALCEKGRDNELLFLASRSELVNEFGQPDITKYGKNYGQGPYCAYNFLGEAGSLYFMRVLPTDAAYSNIIINAVASSLDSTATINFSYNDSLNSYAEIQTALETAGSTYPIAVLYPIGRGEWYNALGVRITEDSNPTLNGVYVLDIYERQSDLSEVIIESFQVSFDPKAVDVNGDSLWIKYILTTYSSVLRCEMVKANDDYSGGYDQVVKVFDKDIGTVSLVLTSGSASITDNKQNFGDWETIAGTNYAYIVIAKDSRGNSVFGWLGTASGTGDESIAVYNQRAITGSDQNWAGGDIAEFDTGSIITYEIKKFNASIADAFLSSDPVPLKFGSEGTLLNVDGSLNTTVAATSLVNGYSGVTDDDVLDTENIYFSAVFDCGYPDAVKTAISTLVQTRKDAVALVDNGDNATATAAITARLNTHTFNNYYVALYEEYNKVFDSFTGQDVWFSPIFHMSYLLPRNDSVAEIWYAIAGFNRAAIDSIKELRFNPKLGQRDQFYLKQINPIVKFAQGYTPWGNLTSQAKTSAMQDLNIVRMVLYVKRALEQFCRNFIFEQNDALTWGAVQNQIAEFLERVKQKRGLYSYSVEVSATDYEKKRKTFHANIILEPTRVVEKIELNFFIK